LKQKNKGKTKREDTVSGYKNSPGKKKRRGDHKEQGGKTGHPPEEFFGKNKAAGEGLLQGKVNRV